MASQPLLEPGATVFRRALAAAPGRPALDPLMRWVGHQRWLRYGLRSRLLRLWCDPQRCPRQAFEAPFVGFVYPGDLSRWIDWLVYFFGAYEEDELELVREQLRERPGAVALDIGANVGHHTLYLASFCAQVHAFEPFAEVARLIADKVERNRLGNVTVHGVGLGDADSELPYFPPADSNVGNGTFVAALAPGGLGSPFRLQVRQADRYLEPLSLPRVDLVKIDVEGFELSVLRGLRETLARYRPQVMLELNDTARAGLGSEQALLALLPPDYEITQIVRPRALAGVLSRRRAHLAPLRWDAVPTRGGYVNLLLRPRPEPS